MNILLFITIASLFLIGTMAYEQQITVKGQVICEKRSMRNVRVELREHDTLDPDDSLAETHTDKDGMFEITGTENETHKIAPYIRITHNCDVSKKGECKRVTDFDVPSEKLNSNGTSFYDMNFVNLNLRGHSDWEKCD